MDTNPMVQGVDTLTDALNATFITMNGNEVILQNDMGNRRVNHAYLPSGYVPVGIKEYGGIIYIAAHNPITGRSQVGSFPSPQRKFDGDNDPTKDKGEINFPSDFLEGTSVIRDEILVNVSGNNILRAGDKFVVYGSVPTGSDSKPDVTNYNNVETDGNKIISPKNKTYTLALGVLNAQNQFVDITPTLVRWDTSNKVMSLVGKSDLYKFNCGYFIPSEYSSDIVKNATIATAKLIKERNIVYANTYAFKLVGPLYLQAKLNHVQEFNYNIFGDAIKNDSGTITGANLYIEAFITYNCPDNITGGNGDNTYSTYDIGTINSTSFTFFNLDNESGSLYPTDTTEYKTQYNPETNLYSAHLIKQFEILADNNTYT